MDVCFFSLFKFQKFAIFLGILTAREFPVRAIAVLRPRAQMPFFFAANSIFLVVSSSVNVSPQLSQTSAENLPNQHQKETHGFLLF